MKNNVKNRKLTHTGQLFGRGIYFAPLSYNSLRYSDRMGDLCLNEVASELTTGWLLLNEVDLGSTYVAKRPFEIVGEMYDSLLVKKKIDPKF